MHSGTWEGPYWILYVLTLSRRGTAEQGRYQSAQQLALEDVERFCMRFGDFLERDARHHLWVASADGAHQVVYDHHQVLYAYGDLDRFAEVAAEHGLPEAEVVMPGPHTHHYHAEFDDDEDALLAWWEWIHSPLRPGDDSGA